MTHELVEVPATYGREGPVVTVLGRDQNLDISNARPSPYWSALKVLVKVGLLATVIGAYPAMMNSAHDVNDAPVDMLSADYWASSDAGVGITLIAREVEGPGWTGDKHAFSPARQLTAQPAWQEGIANSLADYFQLAATNVTLNGEIDPDLAAASRLLRVKPDSEMTPRLVAAAEALARYNGRVHAGIAAPSRSSSDLAQSLTLFASWGETSSQALANQIGHDDGWPASRADIHAYYTARARAHVAVNLLRSAAETHPELTERATLRARLREAEELWQRVAAQDPLIVSNQNGDGAFLPNHLAAMAWHLEQAETATLELAELLRGAEADITLAVADTLTLSPSP